MFKVKLEQAGDTATVMLEGMLNSLSAPQLSARLSEIGPDVAHIVLDCRGLRYIASAGLRVLLTLQTRMDEQEGTLVLRNINDVIRETFNDTGFTDFLTIEEG